MKLGSWFKHWGIYFEHYPKLKANRKREIECLETLDYGLAKKEVSSIENK